MVVHRDNGVARVDVEMSVISLLPAKVEEEFLSHSTEYICLSTTKNS